MRATVDLVLSHNLLNGGIVTLIAFQNGQPIMASGAIGAGDSCCCNNNPDCMGACCTLYSPCMQVTRSYCEAAGGMFMGCGSSCDPDPCTECCCENDGYEITEQSVLASCTGTRAAKPAEYPDTSAVTMTIEWCGLSLTIPADGIPISGPQQAIGPFSCTIDGREAVFDTGDIYAIANVDVRCNRIRLSSQFIYLTMYSYGGSFAVNRAAIYMYHDTECHEAVLTEYIPWDTSQCSTACDVPPTVTVSYAP